jgi:hypothetical protein
MQDLHQTVALAPVPVEQGIDRRGQSQILLYPGMMWFCDLIFVTILPTTVMLGLTQDKNRP